MSFVLSQLRKFRAALLGNVPDSLQQYVKLLLNTEPTVRPDPGQLIKVSRLSLHIRFFTERCSDQYIYCSEFINKVLNLFILAQAVTTVCIFFFAWTIFFKKMFKVDFFDDVGTVTLQFMDTLFQRDNLQKSEFFRGLPKILKNLPKVHITMLVVVKMSNSQIWWCIS